MTGTNNEDEAEDLLFSDIAPEDQSPGQWGVERDADDDWAPVENDPDLDELMGSVKEK